jgi:EAL and modified HD-GYP domain-containing signal transduction protein
VDDKVTPDSYFIERIKFFKEKGYRFASFKNMDIELHKPIIALCDYFFLSALNPDFKNAAAHIKNTFNNISVIVSDVDSANQFSKIKYMNFDLFDGSFYQLPITKSETGVSPLKVNYIQLLNLVRNENFEIEKVADTVQRDTALAISLLRVVNSLGISNSIKSINHATVMLGQKELRKWITTAVTKMMSSDKPSEIAKLSLVRAKFAENLAPMFELALQAPELFLMGLFSTLDIILDMRMEDALQLVKVSRNIEDALVSRKGPYSKVLELEIFYEIGDWVGVNRDIILNKLNSDDIYHAYFEALRWYSGLINMENADEATENS